MIDYKLDIPIVIEVRSIGPSETAPDATVIHGSFSLDGETFVRAVTVSNEMLLEADDYKVDEYLTRHFTRVLRKSMRAA